MILLLFNFRTEKHHRNASERIEISDREQVRDAVKGSCYAVFVILYPNT